MWKTRLISSVRSVRCVTRRLFEENRGSAASSGLRSTDSQKTAHSRWFWMPMKTSFPSRHENGPYGAMAACDAPVRGGGVPP